MPDWTPTQKRMLAVLADGKPHRRKELHACLCDEMGPLSNIRAHLTHIRKRLRPLGMDIVCQLSGSFVCYRWVPTLTKAQAKAVLGVDETTVLPASPA